MDKAVTERRVGANDMIRRLQAGRAEMLVLFCRVAGVDPYAGEKKAPGVGALLQNFCQALVDYVASAHFLLYERIVNGTERRRAVADAAASLYPAISVCTDLAIEFNDKYDCGDHCSQLDDLSADLSQLGQALARRIELEDTLLALIREERG
ncbi:MAG TPA: Rsd/AlgQ family anti-sigma factor [Acidiferrobacteraceae bacterium]|nr:Rsd/AlgQ family anti-sigma factor [Acidiferrobacteraceae bacterium]